MGTRRVNLRCISLLGLASGVLLLGGCDARVVRQRAEQIRAGNERVDREQIARAMREVRKAWAIEGAEWFGRLPDGALLRLEAPEVAAVPLRPGAAFYTGWAGEVTLTAAHWEGRPTQAFATPLEVRYHFCLLYTSDAADE